MAIDLVAQTNMNTVQAPFEFRSCGIIPTGDPTFEEWLSCGEFIKNADKSVHFWIGDWLNYGETKYKKEDYEKVIEQTGFEYNTLRKDKYVSESVQFERRRSNLSFGHHVEVAP